MSDDPNARTVYIFLSQLLGCSSQRKTSRLSSPVGLLACTQLTASICHDTFVTFTDTTLSGPGDIHKPSWMLKSRSALSSFFITP